MKRTALGLGGLVAMGLMAGGTLTAHHSFAAEFDVNRPVMLTGTVSRVAWTNPHAHIHIDVSESGHQGAWDLELGMEAPSGPLLSK